MISVITPFIVCDDCFSPASRPSRPFTRSLTIWPGLAQAHTLTPILPSFLPEQPSPKRFLFPASLLSLSLTLHHLLFFFQTFVCLYHALVNLTLYFSGRSTRLRPTHVLMSQSTSVFVHLSILFVISYLFPAYLCTSSPYSHITFFPSLSSNNNALLCAWQPRRCLEVCCTSGPRFGSTPGRSLATLLTLSQFACAT